MRKGEIRRIIVPSELGYSKYPGLEPVPANKLGAWSGVFAFPCHLLVCGCISAHYSSSIHPCCCCCCCSLRSALQDQQALDSVVKNARRDATLLFDVKLEKAK